MVQAVSIIILTVSIIEWLLEIIDIWKKKYICNFKLDVFICISKILVIIAAILLAQKDIWWMIILIQTVVNSKTLTIVKLFARKIAKICNSRNAYIISAIIMLMVGIVPAIMALLAIIDDTGTLENSFTAIVIASGITLVNGIFAIAGHFIEGKENGGMDNEQE